METVESILTFSYFSMLDILDNDLSLATILYGILINEYMHVFYVN